MAVSGTSGVSGQNGQQTTTGVDAYQNMNIDQFIKLLVSELQNQDPLEPMKNADIVNQVSQIQAIGANQRLSTTLDSVALGQNLATASSMIGKTVTALDDSANEVTGTVSKVGIEDGESKLYIGDQKVSMKNIREVLPAGTS